jgi:predicted phage baseplate assembly protein
VLSQTPVLAGSLVLRVDDGRRARVWRQVESLAGSMPDDEVYTLDATSGEIAFGNGVEGALPPEGFRNIVAERYQVGGGRAGAIGSGAAKRLVGSAPYLTGVNNPLPAVGAADAEPRARTMLRGPEYIRTRDRAVTPADYALMALAAGGIARALAAPGRHPDFPGAFLPGVVTVYVIPSERTPGGPPTASEETLRRVARHLVREVAPAGVEVVAANPRYQIVRIETSLVARSSAVPGELAASAALALDRFLDPVDGGTAHRGWPLGPALAHSELSAVLQNVPGVASVARLAVHLDELRARGCGDHALHAWTLPWPGAHSVDVEAEVDP